jgi:uncharacterized protein
VTASVRRVVVLCIVVVRVVALEPGARDLTVPGSMELFLQGPAGRLEAALWMPAKHSAPRAAAVMCHPHPLFGGTMRTNALFRAARGLQQAGLAVLRFNFRGVEKSEGVHHGQGGEVDDLGAALDWMGERFPGLELWAGGFSFGARTSAERATRDARIARVVLVAMPVLRFDCWFLRELRVPGLLLMAGRDEFGNLTQLRERYPELDPRIELDEIPDVGHFFEGMTHEVTARVHHWAERQLEHRS